MLKLYNRNRQQIFTIKDLTKLDFVEKYNGIHTLDFTIPYFILDNITFQKIQNPAINLIKQFLYIKYKNDWFIIDDITQSEQDNNEYLDIKTNAIGYELKYKNLKNYKTGITTKPVMNLTNTMNDILTLTRTGWTIEYVQASLDTKYRAIDINEKTVLDTILNDICEKWDCIVKFNTETKKLSFVEYANDGINLGLYISDTKYLKSLEKQLDKDTVCTKLKIFGKNGISINQVNPTGQNYITNYSFFKQDGYMSTGLINALNAYETAIANQQGQFNTYTTNKNNLQSQLLTKQDEMDLLYTAVTVGLNAIKARIDIAMANGQDLTSLYDEQATKLSQITAKQIEIDTIKSQISTVDSNINALNTTLTISNYLTPTQVTELDNYTFEKVYNDTAITEQGATIAVLNELLIEAKKKMDLYSQQRFSLTLDIVDFEQAIGIDTLERDRLKIGTNITLKHNDFGINTVCRIIEIKRDILNYKISITIANEKDIKNGFLNIKDILRNSSDTTSFVALNSDSWNEGQNAKDIITQYINSTIDTTTQMIVGGVNNSVQINERGITIVDPTEPQYVQRFTAGAWGISSDEGQTFKIGASKGNIHAEILSGNIIIGNEGRFNAIKMFDTNSNLISEIGKYLDSDGITWKNGIKIQGGALEIIGGIQESQINAESVIKWNNAEVNAKEYIDTALQDLDVTGTEKYAIAEHITSLNMQKEDVLAVYDNVYSNIYLSTGIKTTLLASKNAYVTAHADLIIAINNAVNDLSLKSIMDAKFMIYSTKLADMSTQLQNASNNIASVMAQEFSYTTLNNFVTGTYSTDKSAIQSQIDGKIETYFQTTDPNNWAVEDRLTHNGDMWFHSTSKVLSRYNASTNEWDIIRDQVTIDAYNVASLAKSTADGKRRVFTTTPIAPYDLGDLWVGGTSGDLKVCTNAKAFGFPYIATDWTLATKYANAIFQSTLYNGVKIDSTNGLEVMRSDKRLRTILNATEGIKMQKYDGAVTPSWVSDIFSVDTNGNGVFAGVVNASDFKIDGASVLTTDTKKIKVDFIDVDNLVVNKAMTLDANAVITWNNLPSGVPTMLDIPTDEHITQITRDTITTTNIIAKQLMAGISNGQRLEIANNEIVSYSSGTNKLGIYMDLTSYNIFDGTDNYSPVFRTVFGDFDGLGAKIWMSAINRPLKIASTGANNNISLSANSGLGTIYNEGNLHVSKNLIVSGSVSFQAGQTIDFTGCNIIGLSTTAKFA